MSAIMTQCGQVNGPYFYSALGNRMGSIQEFVELMRKKEDKGMQGWIGVLFRWPAAFPSNISVSLQPAHLWERQSGK